MKKLILEKTEGKWGAYFSESDELIVPSENKYEIPIEDYDEYKDLLEALGKLVTVESARIAKEVSSDWFQRFKTWIKNL